MYPAGVAGIRVRYLSIAAGVRLRVLESGPASGHVVVLVHGWGACVYSFDAMIPSLADAGYRVIAFDLPGHGLSDKPTDPRQYTLDALADVVRDVIDALGVGRCSVVGHSMGAAIALRLAVRGDDAVEKVVLVSPAGLGHAPLITLIRLLSPRFVDPIAPSVLTRTTLRLVLQFGFGTRSRPTERDVEEYWAPSQFEEYARACRACAHSFTWRAVRDAVLRSIRTPVLVLSGSRDRLVLNIRKRARLIPGARVVVVPHGGHIVLQECSDLVNAEVIAFLAERNA